MIEGWALWLVLVGFGLGVAVTAVALWRLPRREDDVGPDERGVEAEWIAGTIERNGGVAPTSLVEEVLDLHAAYLQALRVPGPPPGTAAPPVAPATPADDRGQPGPAPEPSGNAPPSTTPRPAPPPPPGSNPPSPGYTPPPPGFNPPSPGYTPPPPGYAPPPGPSGPRPPGPQPPS